LCRAIGITTLEARVSADTLILKIQFLWGVISRRLVKSCPCFGGGQCFHCTSQAGHNFAVLDPEYWCISSFKSSVTILQCTQLNVP